MSLFSLCTVVAMSASTLKHCSHVRDIRRHDNVMFPVLKIHGTFSNVSYPTSLTMSYLRHCHNIKYSTRRHAHIHYVGRRIFFLKCGHDIGELNPPLFQCGLCTLIHYRRRHPDVIEALKQCHTQAMHTNVYTCTFIPILYRFKPREFVDIYHMMVQYPLQRLYHT